MKPTFNILIVLVVLMFTACTTDITLNLKGTAPELVVDGVITTDTTVHIIQLKKTAGYFSNQAAEMVSGATVTLNDGLKTITLPESDSYKGVYQTPADYYGVAGRTYTLTIDNVDVNGDGIKEEYMASCPIKAVAHIDSVDVKKEWLFQTNMWAVKAWLQDPPVENNYYLIKTYRNDRLVTDSIQKWGVTNDEFFNGKYLVGETFSYFSGTEKSEKLKSGDIIELQLCGITKDYMEFIQEVQTEFWGRNPLFGGQPANIRTNIKQILPVNGTNNPHGYFAAYSMTRGKTVYDGQ